MFEQLLKSKYERLAGLKEKKLNSMEDIKRELEAVKTKLTEAICEEQETSGLLKQRQGLEIMLKEIQEEMEILDSEIAKAEPEHLVSQYQALKEEKNKINDNLIPHREKYKKAEDIFRKAENEWFIVSNKAHSEHENLNRQITNCRVRLHELGTEYEV